jgi:hypothetical protein
MPPPPPTPLPPPPHQDIDLPLGISREDRDDWIVVLLDCCGFTSKENAAVGNRPADTPVNPVNVVPQIQMPAPVAARQPTNSFSFVDDLGSQARTATAPASMAGRPTAQQTPTMPVPSMPSMPAVQSPAVPAMPVPTMSGMPAPRVAVPQMPSMPQVRTGPTQYPLPTHPLTHSLSNPLTYCDHTKSTVRKSLLYAT